MRAGIWVQGCPFRCPGCITKESLPFDGGFEMSVSELADWALAQAGIEGITISGGEPFSQAAELIELIDAVRAKRDIGVLCFTGHILEKLRKNCDANQCALLTKIDLLIDGPYVQSKHADLMWRGSSNQRLLFLTARYEEYVKQLIAVCGDNGAGIEIVALPGGAVKFTGVPQSPGFRDAAVRGLNGEPKPD